MKRLTLKDKVLAGSAAFISLSLFLVMVWCGLYGTYDLIVNGWVCPPEFCKTV